VTPQGLLARRHRDYAKAEERHLRALEARAQVEQRVHELERELTDAEDDDRRVLGDALARNRERMSEPRHRVYSTKRWQKVRAIVRPITATDAHTKTRVAAEGWRFITSYRPATTQTLFFELSNLELVCRVHHGMRECEAKSAFAAITRK
jgi:hypothetical protein